MSFHRKSILFVFLFMSSFVGMLSCIAEEPIEFFVLICSYNNAKWCKKNLESVFCQTYPHWTIYYIDAFSNDGTGAIVEKYVRERGFSNKCTVVHRTRRTMASENFYYAINGCDPHKVVVQLDGDDWFAHSRVLEKIASVYQDPSVWMTYGNYKVKGYKWKSCAREFPKEVIKNCSFRTYKWCYGPLRTFYAALFQKIPKEDFLIKGEFMKAGHDVAFGFPLLEMASHGHFRFIKDVLYVYNCVNPIADRRVAHGDQGEAADIVCPKPPYKPLENLF